ncbi:PAS domain-containing sensor histidine kinase [Flavobacterium sp. 3HN19-14]|uniref:PAS domain-containing sensor histidine kinase n=1 Tax=Flavobacterium sp. 3HN19-14 TaxID=3448133 RepID=UPI003EE23911
MNTAADVTDLNIVNHRLEQSEIRFRRLIEESAVAKCLFTGKDMIVEVANFKMLNAWGKDKSIIGKPLREAVPELIGQPFLDILDDIYLTGKTYEAVNEPAQLMRDGVLHTFYYDFTYKPVFDSDGKIYGIIDTAIDVTDEVIIRKKIEESEFRFRSMIENAPVAIGLTKGDDMIFEIINTPLLKMINKTADIIGKPMLDAIPELKNQPVLDIIYKVYNSGEPYVGIEVPIALLQNDVIEDRYFNISYTPMLEEGKIASILHVATDVTEQVKARKTIEEAQEKARLAIESADLGVYESNLITDEIRTSERFNSIWGIHNAKTRNDIVKSVHPEDLSIREKAHQESLKTGNLHYEARVVWSDNSIHWVRVKGKVIFSEEGMPTTLLGVIQDITEQMQFAEQLTKLVNERTQELHRSNEDLLHFAHVASHDLKEPTRKIKFFGNMLENEFKDNLSEKGLFYMGKIQNATDRMFSMIEGVLTYSALRASEQPIETIDLNEIVDNIEHDLEVLILNKNGKIKKTNCPLSKVQRF